MDLKYAVIGTGAVGGYYGGRLALNGKEVHFLYHSEYDYIKAHGLEVKSVKGDFHLDQMNVYRNSAEMPICDVVLVCMKATQNGLLPEILRPLAKEGTTIVLIQNGLGAEEELAKYFPQCRIAGGMAFICTSRVSPGHIFHADYGELTIGFLDNQYNPAVAEQIAKDFNDSNVPFRQCEDLNLFRWRKLVWNIPYNGLSIILHTTTDKMMQDPAARQLITDLMQETVEGARACGANIKDDFVGKMLESTDRMEPYAPSMRLDYDNGRKLEIEAIYSNPIKAAQAAGYHMRKVEALEQQLRFIQKNELGIQ